MSGISGGKKWEAGEHYFVFVAFEEYSLTAEQVEILFEQQFGRRDYATDGQTLQREYAQGANALRSAMRARPQDAQNARRRIGIAAQKTRIRLVAKSQATRSKPGNSSQKARPIRPEWAALASTGPSSASNLPRPPTTKVPSIPQQDKAMAVEKSLADRTKQMTIDEQDDEDEDDDEDGGVSLGEGLKKLGGEDRGHKHGREGEEYGWSADTLRWLRFGDDGAGKGDDEDDKDEDEYGCSAETLRWLRTGTT